MPTEPTPDVIPSSKKAAPRRPLDIVQQAELQASSAEWVRQWLETRASNPEALKWGSGSDTEAIEQMLLDRREPLITLALARFGAAYGVLERIWNQYAESNKAVRVAVLMNEVVGIPGWVGLPAVIAGKDVKGFMCSLDDEDIAALFSNKTLGNDFLTSFFEQKEPWEGLDEEHRQEAIMRLTGNPRMKATYDGPMDGWAEYRHGETYETAWMLASKVPVTTAWASCLGWLYRELVPKAYSIKNPLEIAARWIPAPEDTKTLAEEQKSIEDGRLAPYGNMRKGLARLAVRAARHNGDEHKKLLTHEDPAVRAAAYFGSEMTLEEMREAGERDLMLSFEEMLENPQVWRTKEKRECLRTMAWDNRRDPKNYLDPQNSYNWHLKHYQEKFPEWFKDEEEQPDPETLPVTNSGLTSALDEIKQTLEATGQIALHGTQLQTKTLTRLAWIGWGIAAVLALILFKRL